MIRPQTTLLAVLLASILLYLPLLESDFTNWDDPAQVLENPNVIGFSPGKIPDIFSTTVVSEYHPLITLLYGVEYRIFGPSGFFFHLGNLVWHLLNVSLLFLLLRRLGISRGLASLAGCALFALHPFQVATLGWVSARKDLVCTAFTLLAILAYLSEKSPWRNALVIVFTLLALLAKAVAATIPLVLLGLELSRPRKGWKRELRWLLLLLAVGAVFGFLALQLQPIKPGRENPGSGAIFPAARALIFYLGRFLFPLHLSTIYPELPGEYVFLPANLLRVMGATGILLLATAAFLRKGGAHRLAAWGIFLALLNLIPVLRLVPFGGEEIVAPRFCYLPLTGIAVALAFLLEKHPPGETAKSFLGLILLGFLLGNLAYQEAWRNGTIFWETALARYPAYPIAHHQLGDAHWRAGRVAEAAAACASARELDPGLEKAWLGEAVSLWTLGRRREALAVLVEGRGELQRRKKERGAEVLRRCWEEYRAQLELEPSEVPPTQDENSRTDQEAPGPDQVGDQGPKAPAAAQL